MISTLFNAVFYNPIYNALVALALLIAESNPEEKDALIKLVTNLLT